MFKVFDSKSKVMQARLLYVGCVRRLPLGDKNGDRTCEMVRDICVEESR